jgi:hypothetical protein
MTNPILYIRNKFCFWITGLTHSEIEEIVEKYNNIPTDYISKSDFDPDDYDFDPLKDYDFSEFITSNGFSDHIVDNDVVQQCDLDDKLSEYTDTDTLNEQIEALNKRIEALEPKKKKINLEKKPKQDGK